MAEDALGIYLYHSLSEDGEEFPKASNPIDIKCNEGDIDLVKWDEEEYLKEQITRL